MRAKLWHYTLNSNHTYNCAEKQFYKAALEKLSPLAIQAKKKKDLLAPLPNPLERYTVKIASTPGAAIFDVYAPKTLILTSNAVAWEAEKETNLWEAFENLYLNLCKQFDTILGSPPVKPSHLPWLATVILPNPEIIKCGWLADFEQCMALAIISANTQEPLY